MESLKIKPISRLAVRLDVGRDKEGLDHGDSLSKKKKKKEKKWKKNMDGYMFDFLSSCGFM